MKSVTAFIALVATAPMAALADYNAVAPGVPSVDGGNWDNSGDDYHADSWKPSSNWQATSSVDAASSSKHPHKSRTWASGSASSSSWGDYQTGSWAESASPQSTSKGWSEGGHGWSKSDDGWKPSSDWQAPSSVDATSSSKHPQQSWTWASGSVGGSSWGDYQTGSWVESASPQSTSKGWSEGGHGWSEGGHGWGNKCNHHPSKTNGEYSQETGYWTGSYDHHTEAGVSTAPAWTDYYHAPTVAPASSQGW